MISELALQLRAARLKSRLTVTAAADLAGLSRWHLMNIEGSAADGCNPTLKTILALSRLYNLAPEFWFNNSRLPKMSVPARSGPTLIGISKN